MRRCPICKRAFDPDAGDSAAPFCSSRCKLIDLGNWLGEGYRIPTEDSGRPEDEPPPERRGEEPQ